MPKKCSILCEKMDELRELQDVGLVMVFGGILDPWDPGSLGPRSQGPTDPGSRKGHNNPSPTRRPKMAPDVRLGSIFPWERGRLGHCRLGPFLDTSKRLCQTHNQFKLKTLVVTAKLCHAT